jgi:surface carbohydrate biosynthesis protein
MRRVDAIFLVEHIARELDVACAVQHLAKRRHGLRLEVLPVQSSHKYAVRNLRTRTLVVPFSYRINDPYTRDFIRSFPGCTILNLAWEELFYKAYELEKLPSDRFTREYVLHHVWGDFHRDRLVRAGVPASHVFVNGHPTYMLYHEPYRGFYPSRQELAGRHGLDPRKRWLLFPENYGWAFYPQQRIAELVRNGIPQETIDELSQFCSHSLRTVLRWLAILASKHDMEVILRPRPATLVPDFVAVMRQSLSEVPAGLHVIKQESVCEWILVSDLVASSYSTTLIEAAVAGKQAFMLTPLPLPPGLRADWYQHVPQIATEEDFISVCTARRDPGAVDELTRWARRTLLGRGDPIVGLADLLAKITARRFRRPAPPSRDFFSSKYPGWRALRLPGDTLSILPRRLRERLRFARKRREVRRRIPARKSYVLESREVPPHLRKWLDPGDLFDAVEVERVGRRWQEHLG